MLMSLRLLLKIIISSTNLMPNKKSKSLGNVKFIIVCRLESVIKCLTVLEINEEMLVFKMQ